MLAIEHATEDDLIAYMDERGYAHVASREGDHIFLNKADGVVKEKPEWMNHIYKLWKIKKFLKWLFSSE